MSNSLKKHLDDIAAACPAAYERGNVATTLREFTNNDDHLPECWDCYEKNNCPVKRAMGGSQ